MSKISKKFLAGFLVAAMMMTQLLFTSVASAAVTSARLAGQDRYETALRISQNGWGAGSTQYAVIAYGEDFPDALSAAPLAKKYNAPILLTAKDSLSAGVLDELNRIGATNVFIVGGEGVVSKNIADALTAAGKTVTRLAGDDRYETSLKVAEQIGATDTVVVAYGENYPDALSIAPIAAAKGWPILLTETNSMDDAVRSFIGSKKAYVVGGSGVVSDTILNSLTGAERLAGIDRYETNVAVMNKFAAELNFEKVFLATGEDFADALAGAALAAKTLSPVVLVGATMPAATQAFINSKVTATTTAVALGGSAVVSDEALAAVGSDLSGVLQITGVTTLTQDGRGIRVSFNKPVSSLSTADVTVVDKDSLDMVGVESVALSSNKMAADIWFLEDNGGYIQQGKTYQISVAVDGSTLAFDYQRPYYTNLRVVEVNADDREITLEDGSVLTVPETVEVDFQEILGRSAKVWSDNDKNVTRLELDSETVKYDAIELDKANKEVDLVDEDKSYDLADDVILYANDDDSSTTLAAMGTEYDYAKVVLDKNGDVIFISAYELEENMVVKSVDENEVIGYNDELDVEDFIIVKDGKQITAADIEEGDILFYNTSARNNDGFAEVFNKTVTGEIGDITNDTFIVDDEEFEFTGVKYLDGNTLKNFDSDIAEEMQESGEDVVVYVDRNGDAVFVSGDRGDVAKTTVVGYLYENVVAYKDARSGELYLPVDMINESGEKVSYDVKFSSLTAGTETNINPATVTDGATVITKDQLIKVKLNSDGDIAELYVNGASDFAKADITSTVKTTAKYVAGYKLSSSTVVFLTEEYNVSSDEDDITVVKWGDELNFTEITASTESKSYVYHDADYNADYIIANDTNTEDDATVTSTVITEITKLTTDNVYRIKAMINGESKTIYTKDESSVFNYFRDNVVTNAQAAITANGYYAAKLLIDDNTGRVVNKAGDAITVMDLVEAEGVVISRSTSSKEITITVDAAIADDPNTEEIDETEAATVGTYKLADSYQVFDASNKTNVKSYTLQSVKAGDKVVLVRDNENFIKFAIVVEKAN
ncbi:N-acetylmuramoyl-L-alanine amidase LytC precursor [Oxobacter pfennigii]|uniref:N-acetylmuramoyl-L-alanine amidase LytC n=1 Tax=Oxobacter pfennigii TaxID=36849 RepID=A0A0P8WMC9_9CLOT|nr:cell wall-binding repeat-containing protein [Oxobacter pfennigii]KPU43674.1 N-acetylmuramoyl-L-alanine amidase LytC precursor [Oxobacter pfennigii]